ncbi:HD domain-containing protein [candidate division KSB1 bacterium]|nr:MAG: HD domain-containing protein [candidate division KSB1 bacterium]
MVQDELDLLIVDDDHEILRLLVEVFKEQSLKFETASSIAEARDKLAHYAFKVVLSDHNLTDGNGIDFLAEFAGLGIRSVAILMTGLMDQNVAIQAINRGKVYKFITKPLDLTALMQIVRRAIEYYSAQRANETLTREVLEFNERLRRETESQERQLEQAAKRIRREEETVEKQRVHIEALYSEIQKAYLHTVTSLTAAIEAKDYYTKGHSVRVFYYCSLMADVLVLPDNSRNDLRIASVLHDLGKIGISDAILRKPDRLTPEEFQIMASHPVLTDSILKPLPFLTKVRKIIREHHERFNGTGYPDSLKGMEISLEGRILAVADAYDAMRSDRAYRKALDKSIAEKELKNGSGTQFCPLCVGALLYGLESRGEWSGQAPSDWSDKKWEEEFVSIKPAADTIPVNALVN